MQDLLGVWLIPHWTVITSIIKHYILQ